MAHHSITRHARQSPFPTSGSDLPDFLFYRGEFAHRSLEDPPRLVLLDSKLPKVDGLEVLRAVKSDPCTKAIPAVVLAASREERHLVESYRLGSNGNIQTPGIPRFLPGGQATGASLAAGQRAAAERSSPLKGYSDHGYNGA
jgi:CheY-like chemotaxis protein